MKARGHGWALGESFLGALEEAVPGGEEGFQAEEGSGERAGGVAWLGPELGQHAATTGPTVCRLPDLQPCTGDKTQALGS